MHDRKSIYRLVLLLALAYTLHFPNSGDKSFAAGADVVLTVKAETGLDIKLTLSELSKLPRRSVRATDESGKESLFEGVPLGELLKLAGVKFGKELGGKALANYLLVEAADGYRVVFALPELDPAFTDAIILLADRRDGQPLSEKDGKLRVIVPHEKRHARWVRGVTALRVELGR